MDKAIVQSLPATQLRLQQYKEVQARDLVCSELIEFCRQGWPSKSQLKPELKPYWEAQHMLTLSNDLLLYGPRIVVPLSVQKQTLEKLHQGHQGIYRDAVYVHKALCGGLASQSRSRRGCNSSKLLLDIHLHSVNQCWQPLSQLVHGRDWGQICSIWMGSLTF